MKKDILGLTDEDVSVMRAIDAKAAAAGATLRVAMDHHGATINHLGNERDEFWASLRERFGFDPDAQFRIAKVDGFWQVLPIEEPEEAEPEHKPAVFD